MFYQMKQTKNMVLTPLNNVLDQANPELQKCNSNGDLKPFPLYYLKMCLGEQWKQRILPRILNAL